MPPGTSSRQLIQDWADLDLWLARYVANQYVPTLQQFAQFLMMSGRVNVDIRKGERKEVLLAKVNEGFRTLMRNGQFSAYQQIRAQCEGIGRRVNSWSGYPPPPPPPTFGGVPAPAASSSLSSPSAAPLPTGPRHQSSSQKQWPHASSSSSTSGWSSSNPHSHTLLDWKTNPMFKAVKALTAPEMLPDIGASESSHTNRRKQVTFYLPQDVVAKLQQTKTNPNTAPRYGLRVFCTSSEFYRPPGMSVYPGAFSATNRMIPMEYPSNPDFAFEGVPLAFRERGLRGKPGSAPPFDLSKANVTLVTSRLNTLTMGHTGPTVGKKKDISKRFYFQVVLAEIVTKDELLDQLLKKTPTSIKDSLAAARSRMEDDDIVAESSRMTLKDPLSYMRITQPIRSTSCTHIQCFDAKWWIEGNAQHPQFLCPLCNRSLRFDDLIVDGYFLSILNAVPDSVDEVIVDANFEWATEDGKYSSVKKEADAPDPVLPAEAKTPTANGMPPSPSETPHGLSPSPKAIGKRKAIEILSSDDEDDQPLSLRPPPIASSSTQSRPAPLRTPSASASVPPTGRGDVIDLTLSDSDDEADPPQNSHRSHFHPPGAATITTDSRSAVPHFSSRPVPKAEMENIGVRQEQNAAPTYVPPIRSDPHQLPDIDTSSLSMPMNRHEQDDHFRRRDPVLFRYDRYRDAPAWDEDRRQPEESSYDYSPRDHYSPPRFGGQNARYGPYSPPRPTYRSNEYDRTSDASNKRYRASEWMREDMARGYGVGDYNSRNQGSSVSASVSGPLLTHRQPRTHQPPSTSRANTDLPEAFGNVPGSSNVASRGYDTISDDTQKDQRPAWRRIVLPGRAKLDALLKGKPDDVNSSSGHCAPLHGAPMYHRQQEPDAGIPIGEQGATDDPTANDAQSQTARTRATERLDEDASTSTARTSSHAPQLPPLPHVVLDLRSMHLRNHPASDSNDSLGSEYSMGVVDKSL